MASDGDLIARTRNGDMTAFRDLMQRYQEIAFRTAFVVTRDRVTAEDAVQEGFIRAYDALPRFRTGAPFRPWLLRIVANAARNQRRATDRRDELLQRAGRLEPGELILDSPEQDLITREERERVHHALQHLSDTDRVVLTLRYYLDLSPGEIATILECPERTVRSRLARALKRLETLLTTAMDVESSETVSRPGSERPHA